MIRLAARDDGIVIDADATARARRDYDAYADRYDRETGWYERAMLGDGRAWAGSLATGRVLEVAIGTGRNLPHYRPGTDLTGVDLSFRMLCHARSRAARFQGTVTLIEADAQALPFPAAAFDTALCTLGLSSIPSDAAAVAEMNRVLRRDGRLVLLGHVASRHRFLRAAQHVIERVAASRAADHQTRRVAPLVSAAGFTVTSLAYSRGGIIERLVATKR